MQWRFKSGVITETEFVTFCGERERWGGGKVPSNLVVISADKGFNALGSILAFGQRFLEIQVFYSSTLPHILQMAEGTAQSHYVKLTKEQAPVEDDITPGELNQPIPVPQLNVHRCVECGQPLPESYQPPADEDWTTGICGCAEDPESCWTGLFCPCVLFGRNVETLREDIPWSNACVCHALCVEGGMALAAATAIFHGIDPKTSFLICEGLLFAWWMCGIYTGLFRQSLQKKYHLKNSPCDPCLVHCCMHWCAICQEHREMKGHLSDNAVMPMTIVNPPPVQEMNAGENQETTTSSGNGIEHTNLEMQPL